LRHNNFSDFTRSSANACHVTSRGTCFRRDVHRAVA